MAWLIEAMNGTSRWGFAGEALTVAVVVLGFVGLFTLPLLALMFLDRVAPQQKWLHAIFYGGAVVMIVVFYREVGQDFIYFQF